MREDSSPNRPTAEGAPPRRPAPGLLRLPLPLKILVANGALVAGTAVLAVLLARLHENPVVAAGLAALVGLAVSVPINWILVRLALSPLAGLQGAAERVHAGDLEARAPDSALADRGMARLISVFNDMLNRLVRSQRTLRRLSVGALDAAERERRSLASELQEDAAQRLATLLLRVELARKVVGREGGCEEASLHLEALRDEAAQSLDLVRRLARRLHPPELGDLGLVAALRAHARAVADQAGLPVDVEVEGAMADLEPEVALALYRVAEEALVNAVRHAEARSIHLQFRTDGGTITLVISDDGRGFEPGIESRHGSGGLGLLGMRERARSVGGSLVIASAPGAGARVAVTVPRTRRDPSEPGATAG